MPTRAEFLAEVRTWKGTRWGHQGRLKGSRVDCIGVPLVSAKNLGLMDLDFREYGWLPVPSKMEPLLDKHLDRVPPGEEKPGDIIYMKDPQRGGAYRHLAVYAGETIIHADSSFGECVEHRFSEADRKAVKRFYRIRGLED